MVGLDNFAAQVLLCLRCTKRKRMMMASSMSLTAEKTHLDLDLHRSLFSCWIFHFNHLSHFAQYFSLLIKLFKQAKSMYFFTNFRLGVNVYSKHQNNVYKYALIISLFSKKSGNLLSK